MTYDSTLGYADLQGYPCGTFFEYPAVDPVAQEAINIRVRPLIAMECTVIAARYTWVGSGDVVLCKFKGVKSNCLAMEW
jgi:hypothetical protein